MADCWLKVAGCSSGATKSVRFPHAGFPDEGFKIFERLIENFCRAAAPPNLQPSTGNLQQFIP